MSRTMLAMGAFVLLCTLGTVLCAGAFIGRELAKCQPPQSVAEFQLYLHEQQGDGPTPAGAQAHWIEERYTL